MSFYVVKDVLPMLDQSMKMCFQAVREKKRK